PRTSPRTSSASCAWPRSTAWTSSCQADNRSPSRQQFRQVVARAGDRPAVALLFDLGSDQLEVERAPVPGGEQLADDAAQRDVAVARHEAIRCGQRSDGVVTDLHDADAVDVVRDRSGEVALGPAGV